MAAIELEGLTKIYGDGTRAVHELSLDIADGEFVVFVGPSGCGKILAGVGLTRFTPHDGGDLDRVRAWSWLCGRPLPGLAGRAGLQRF